MTIPSLFDPESTYEPPPAPVLDITEARRRRDEAIAEVERNADEQWKHSAREAVMSAALRHREFTTDVVWQILHDRGVGAPREPRAMGAITRWACTQRLIVATDRVEMSARPECHGRPARIWRSLVADVTLATQRG